MQQQQQQSLDVKKRSGRLKLPLPLPLPTVSDPGPLPNFATFQLGDQTVTTQASELQVIRRLGEGAFGTVDLVQHAETQCQFARKRVQIKSDSVGRELQLREINLLRRTIGCPFSVHFYAAMQHDGEMLILMELMDVSLKELYIKAYDPQVNQPLPDKVLRFIAYSVLRALSYMRGINVMHRDVKPSNILANRAGEVKMCDFGVSGNLCNSISKTNVGSELYVAPERIDSGSNQCPGGFRSVADVWSLGISLIELATGKHPFGQANIANSFQIYNRIIRQPPPTLPLGDPRFGPELHDFLAKCLVKNPDERSNFDQLLGHVYVAEIKTDGARETELRQETGSFVCGILDAGVQI